MQTEGASFVSAFFLQVLIYMQANLFWLLSQFISAATKQPITLIKKASATQTYPVNKLHWNAQNELGLLRHKYRDLPSQGVITVMQVTIKMGIMHGDAKPLPVMTNTIRKLPLCRMQLKNRPVCMYLSINCLPGNKILNHWVIWSPKRQLCKQRVAAYQKTPWIGGELRTGVPKQDGCPFFQPFGSLKYWFYWVHRLEFCSIVHCVFPSKRHLSLHLSLIGCHVLCSNWGKIMHIFHSVETNTPLFVVLG